MVAAEPSEAAISAGDHLRAAQSRTPLLVARVSRRIDAFDQKDRYRFVTAFLAAQGLAVDPIKLENDFPIVAS